MNFVLIGNFVAASRNDSRAIASVTPSTSNNTLAGRITATHDSCYDGAAAPSLNHLDPTQAVKGPRLRRPPRGHRSHSLACVGP